MPEDSNGNTKNTSSTILIPILGIYHEIQDQKNKSAIKSTKKPRTSGNPPTPFSREIKAKRIYVEARIFQKL